MAGPWAGTLREEALLPGYFFFGEEDYLADEFVEELRDLLTASSDQEFHLTRLDLDEAKWPEVIDAARTAPFLFEPWRAIVVRFPEKKAGSDRGKDRASGAEGDEARAPKLLSALDQAILRDYFADPSTRTVIVVVRAGRVRKDDAVVRFFSSLPKSAFSVTEMKRLPEQALKKRADDRARALGKTLTESAKQRLFDILGQDLRLMMNEVDKLAVFVGDKKGIEADDVDQATAGQRSFQAYDLDDALAAADFAKCAAVLNDLLTEERTEVVVGRLAGFFRNILAAQTWLREKSRMRDEIFQALYPYIQKGWSMFAEKSKQFFGAVEGLSPSELNSLLLKLRELDRTLKSSGTKGAGEKILLEAFVRTYCLARKR